MTHRVVSSNDESMKGLHSRGCRKPEYFGVNGQIRSKAAQFRYLPELCFFSLEGGFRFGGPWSVVRERAVAPWEGEAPAEPHVPRCIGEP
jgi:hypothetical protein